MPPWVMTTLGHRGNCVLWPPLSAREWKNYRRLCLAGAAGNANENESGRRAGWAGMPMIRGPRGGGYTP